MREAASREGAPEGPSSRRPLAAAALLALLTVLSTAPARPAAGASWTGYAVIVGISDYEGTGADLAYCSSDALDLYHTLASDPSHWQAANMTLLVDGQATEAAIQAALNGRLAEADLDAQGVFLFFFSGHGTTAFDFDNDEIPPSDDQDEGLATYDWGSGVILDDELGNLLDTAPGVPVCMIIDACLAGGMTKALPPSSTDAWLAGLTSDIRLAVPRRTGAKAGRSAAAKDVDQAGVVLLMACDEGQDAQEDAILRNGVFSFYVIEALRRRAADVDWSGFVSAEEAYLYAMPLAAAWNPQQTAQLYDTHTDERDLITAADRPVERIVTPDDLPFGDQGCSSGGGPGGNGSPAGSAAVLGLLAVALLARRRRRSAAAALLALVLAAGCVLPFDPTAPPRLGARAGWVRPFAEENLEYLSSGQVGLYVRTSFPGRRFDYELGIDYCVL
ncbi:MAG: caspase family protein, partial [Planctomycetota bacterium]